jgi:chemotaxis protein methyltransferase CheR
MLPLLPQVFNILGALIEERAGLHYRIEDLELLRDKVSARAEQLGFDSLLDYYYYLRYDANGGAELDTLVEHLVVHETYFFRELDQLQVLARHLVPALLASREPVRIWCAAAATGEEPLTLAMLLAEEGSLRRCRMVATDISERALGRARRGEFGGRSTRALTSGMGGRWLERRGDSVSVHPEVHAAVEWKRLNLLDETAISAMGEFDVVLLRNALIYFADATVRRVLASLERALAPGGYLLVGASESLLRYGTGFACEEHAGAFFYRRVS